MIGQSGGHIGLAACQFAPLEWRARQLMLDLVDDVLEDLFTMIEMSDGSALLPLATEFLPWAHIGMCGESMRERVVTANDASDALSISDQRRWRSLFDDLGLFKNTHHITSIWRCEAFPDGKSS